MVRSGCTGSCSGPIICGQAFWQASRMGVSGDELGIEEQLRRAGERLHILDAIAAVVEDLQDFLRVVVEANDLDDANVALRARYGFDEMQAEAVLDMQFRRTTNLDRDRIRHQRDEVAAEVLDLSRRISKTSTDD